MDQPVFWAALMATAVVGVGARLAARRPLWPRHARRVPAVELAAAAGAVAVLVFHCAAMFFREWVDVVPVARALAASVRALELTSQVTYWVPAMVVVLALRRVWLPALGLLVVVLGGVGVTMFVPHALSTHLAWLAAAAVTVVLIGSALVVPLRREDDGAA